MKKIIIILLITCVLSCVPRTNYAIDSACNHNFIKVSNVNKDIVNVKYEFADKKIVNSEVLIIVPNDKSSILHNASLDKVYNSYVINNLKNNEKYAISINNTYLDGTIISQYGYINLENCYEGKVLKPIIQETVIINAQAKSNIYESEPKDTFETADLIYNDGNVYGNFTSESEQLDIYKIKFNENGNANFFLSNIPSGCDYDLLLFDDNQNSIEVSTNGGNSNELISQQPVVAGKWYYIKVHRYSGTSSSNYVLRAKNYSQIIDREMYHSPTPPQSSSIYRHNNSPYNVPWGADMSHKGFDIIMPEGTNLYATHPGKIYYRYAYKEYNGKVYLTSYGLFSEIKNTNHNNKVIMTRYCHMKKYGNSVPLPVYHGSKIERGGYWNTVNPSGLYTSKGSVIGESGNTGYSNPAHLHFEFHLGVGNHQDPDKYIPLVGHDSYCYYCHYGYGNEDYHNEYTYGEDW